MAEQRIHVEETAPTKRLLHRGTKRAAPAQAARPAPVDLLLVDVDPRRHRDVEPSEATRDRDRDPLRENP